MIISISIILVVLLIADIYFRNRRFKLEQNSISNRVTDSELLNNAINQAMEKIANYERIIREQNDTITILNRRLQAKNDVVANKTHRRNLFCSCVLESLIGQYGKNLTDFKDWKEFIVNTSDELTRYLEEKESEK